MMFHVLVDEGFFNDAMLDIGSGSYGSDENVDIFRRLGLVPLHITRDSELMVKSLTDDALDVILREKPTIRGRWERAAKEVLDDFSDDASDEAKRAAVEEKIRELYEEERARREPRFIEIARGRRVHISVDDCSLLMGYEQAVRIMVQKAIQALQLKTVSCDVADKTKQAPTPAQLVCQFRITVREQQQAEPKADLCDQQYTG